MDVEGKLRQHRYVVEEPRIPFEYEILHVDDNIIVIDKPHFLATMPRGMWYRETALIRLREQFGEPDITPAHRLDRLTAGVVVFVRNPKRRGAYQMLFQERCTTKTYECLAPLKPPVRPRYGTIRRLDSRMPFPLERRSHIVKERGFLQAYETPDTVNAETVIERAGGMPGLPGVARYVLHPHTGKTHQLRVHMNSLGLPILGDDFYPEISKHPYDDFRHPLELVARTLEFVDPISGEPRRFDSRVELGARMEPATMLSPTVRTEIPAHMSPENAEITRYTGTVRQH